jgi:hypothetical protein
MLRGDSFHGCHCSRRGYVTRENMGNQPKARGSIPRLIATVQPELKKNSGKPPGCKSNAHGQVKQKGLVFRGRVRVSLEMRVEVR